MKTAHLLSKQGALSGSLLNTLLPAEFHLGFHQLNYLVTEADNSLKEALFNTCIAYNLKHCVPLHKIRPRVSTTITVVNKCVPCTPTNAKDNDAVKTQFRNVDEN